MIDVLLNVLVPIFAVMAPGYFAASRHAGLRKFAFGMEYIT